MKRVLRIVMCLTVAVAALSIVTESGAAEPIKVKYRADDSLITYGWLSLSPNGADAPLLVLLHQRADDHTSWDPYLPHIERVVRKKKRPHVLTVDLRGHGASTQMEDFQILVESMPNEQFAMMPSDVAGLIKTTLAEYGDRIDTTDIRILGASIGANTAIMCTEFLPNVSRLALLSPGEKYAGMEPVESLVAFGGGKLMYANKDDILAEASLRYFQKRDSTVIGHTLPGYAHGIKIFEKHPEVIEDVFDWLLNKD